MLSVPDISHSAWRMSINNVTLCLINDLKSKDYEIPFHIRNKTDFRQNEFRFYDLFVEKKN